MKVTPNPSAFVKMLIIFKTAYLLRKMVCAGINDDDDDEALLD